MRNFFFVVVCPTKIIESCIHHFDTLLLFDVKSFYVVYCTDHSFNKCLIKDLWNCLWTTKNSTRTTGGPVDQS